MTFCVMDVGCSVYDDHSKTPGLSYRNPLCQGCRDHVRSDLNLLRYDYIDLSQLLVPADARNEGKIFRPKPESKPNMNMAAFYLRGDIAWLLNVTYTVLHVHCGTRPTLAVTPVREGYALDHQIRWLRERVDDLADLPAKQAYWQA